LFAFFVTNKKCLECGGGFYQGGTCLTSTALFVFDVATQC